MALFELEDGRLVPAQFGHNVPGGFTQDVIDAVRAQILEVVSRPLFPITWGDLRGDTKEESPRLTALDAAGQVVAVEVVETLDADGLIEALSQLADTAAMSWADLAREYPRGIRAFKQDWIKFREAMPTSPPNGPRLVLVAAQITEEVRPALDVLSSSGVEVHEMSLRQMRNGRAFLEVEAVGHRLYTHRFTPVLEGQDALPGLPPPPPPTSPLPPSAQLPTASKPLSAEPSPAASKAPAPAPSPARQEPVAAPSSMRAPAAPAPTVPEAPKRPAVRPAPTAWGKPPTRPVRGRDVPEGSSKDDRVKWISPSEPLPQTRDVMAGRGSHASRRPRQVSRPRVGSRAYQEPQRTGRRAALPAKNDDAVGFNSKGLQELGRMLGADTPLVLRDEGRGGPTAFLTASGLIAAGTDRFEDPTEALIAVGVHSQDGWDAWYIYDTEGPTLREAIQEVV